MDEENEIWLRVERQRAAVIRILYWTLILGLCFLGVRYLLPTLLPFLLAYLIAWALNRPMIWLRKKAHIPRPVSAVALVILFTSAASGLLVLLGTGLVAGVKSVAKIFPALFNQGILPGLEYFFASLERMVANISPEIGSKLASSMDNVFGLISEGVVQLCGSVAGSLGGLLAGVPGLLMKILVTIIASVFIASDFPRIQKNIWKLVPTRGRKVLHEAGKFFGKTVPKCLLSYLLIFMVTFCELWLGFSIFRIPSGMLIAVLVALLDILPVLGTGTVLIPWAVISLLQKNFTLGIELLVLYVVITVIRQMLEPKLVGMQIQLHPVITFAAMLTGVRFFGFAGMFGLPLLIAFLRQLYEKKLLFSPVHVQDEGSEETEQPEKEPQSKEK